MSRSEDSCNLKRRLSDAGRIEHLCLHCRLHSSTTSHARRCGAISRATCRNPPIPQDCSESVHDMHSVAIRNTERLGATINNPTDLRLPSLRSNVANHTLRTCNLPTVAAMDLEFLGSLGQQIARHRNFRSTQCLKMGENALCRGESSTATPLEPIIACTWSVSIRTTQSNSACLIALDNDEHDVTTGATAASKVSAGLPQAAVPAFPR